MNTDESGIARLNPITERVIGCAYKVGNTLGAGFLEKIYENALVHELRKSGLKAEQQVPITVWYDGVQVGECFIDVVVEDRVLLELKAVRAIDDAHCSQCINYLAATRFPMCLLINFTSRVQIKRFLGPGVSPLDLLNAKSPPTHPTADPKSVPSVQSVANSPPVTYAEQAEWDDP